jgi:hypothetical protein
VVLVGNSIGSLISLQVRRTNDVVH